MGVRGAALATVIAQGVSAILCFIYMAKKYPNLRFDSNARALSLPIIKKLTNIAVPMALQYSITAVGAVILQSAVNTLGSAKVAAIAAAQKTINVLYSTNGYDGINNGYLLWTKLRSW